MKYRYMSDIKLYSIAVAFNWKNSPEGYNYWKQLYIKYRKLENLEYEKFKKTITKH